MVCRLCLNDLHDFIQIFNDENACEESEIGKIIMKYVHIELTANDVSNKICKCCWQHLNDFHQFYQMVEEKQQQLQLKPFDHWTHPLEFHGTLVEPQLNAELSETLLDVKDVMLCEPEINTLLNTNDDYKDVRTKFELDEEFAAAMSSENERDDGSILSEEIAKTKTKRKSKKITTRKARIKKQKTIDDAVAADVKPKRQYIKRSDSLKDVVVRVPKRSQRLHSKADTTLGDTSCSPMSKLTSPESQLNAADEEKSQPTVMDDQNESTKNRSKHQGKTRELDAYIAEHAALHCSICEQPLKDFLDLKRHFRKEHNCTGYVPCCNNRYKKRILYVDHLKVHEDPNYFRCSICCKNLKNRSSYDQHMFRYHSSANDLKYECPHCPEKFIKKYILSIHMKIHEKTLNDTRTHVCEECQKAFRTPNELKAHIKRMHLNENETHICDICGNCFRSKQILINHRIYVHNLGEHKPEAQCGLCKRWLRNERCLKRHLNRHRDVDSGNIYKCKDCGEEKNSRSALSSHRKYHHSEKRFKCTMCAKEFARPRCLDEHIATHTGKDLYTCSFCPQTFKSHANMHNHKRKMHPDQWVRKYTQPSSTIVQPVSVVC